MIDTVTDAFTHGTYCDTLATVTPELARITVCQQTVASDQSAAMKVHNQRQG